MSNLSREARIYLALWRKTASTPEGFEVKFPTLSLAIAGRQGLYRAMKGFRGRPDLDPILAEAGDKFVVTLDSANFSIRFTPRQTLEALEAQLSSLGLNEDSLLTEEERRVQSSLDSLFTQLDSPEVPTRSTPFYDRKD